MAEVGQHPDILIDCWVDEHGGEHRVYMSPCESVVLTKKEKAQVEAFLTRMDEQNEIWLEELAER